VSGKAHKQSYFKPGIVVKDTFRPLSEYAVDPLTWTAIALHVSDGGQKMHRWDQCIAEAKVRAIGEKAVVGEAGLRVMLRPPADAWPPEAWLREFVKPKWLLLAKQVVTEDYGKPQWAETATQ